MPPGRWKLSAEIYLIFKTRKRSRKFLESAKRSRPRSKNWPALENSNTSKNYGRNFRRRREIVRDVDLVVATKKPAAITEFFIKHALAESIIAQGPTKTSVRLRSGIQCDLRVVTSAEYPFALNYFTGSKEHNIEMRSRALKRGWTLNEFRLARLPPDPKAKKARGGRAIKRQTVKIPTYRD